MKILVTGANGYLGQGIVKQLIEDNNEVIACDLSLDNVDNRAKKVQADIFSLTNPYEYFGEPDVVIHLAWRNGFVHNAISHMEDLPSHYLFIKHLLDGGLKHIAVLGTMHEIGFYEGCINENTPTNPQSLYGISKDALRKATFLLCEEHKAICQWIRGYYIVGNSHYGSSIFSKITKAVQEGKTTFPFTTGTNQWDFIDYNDFSFQVASIVEQKKINGIINSCSGYPEKLSNRVEKFIKDEGYKIKLEYGAFPDRPYDSKAVWGSNKKIMEILNEKNY